MSTTALFAEIVVIGLLALMAAAASAAAIFGFPVDWLSQLRDCALAATAATVAIAYPIGIVVDRITDSIAQATEKKWFPSRVINATGLKEPAIRLQIWAKAPARTVEFLDYARGRRRVVRSTAVIAFALAVALAAASVRRGAGYLALATVAFLITTACLYAWRKIGAMYDSRLVLAYRMDVLGQDAAAGNDLPY